MSSHPLSKRQSVFRTLSIAGLAILAAVGSAASTPAAADTAEQLTWLRNNACSRAERSAGSVDIDGECVGHTLAVGEADGICAGHFCPAHPGERGARIIHPSDFGPTE